MSASEANQGDGAGLVPGVPVPVQNKALGRALLVMSWPTRIVGALVTLVSAQLGYSTAANSQSVLPLGPWYIKSPICGLFMAIGLIGIASSGRMRRTALRHLIRVVTPADLAPGSYVLYLRPFSLDATMSAFNPVPKNLTLFTMGAAIATSTRTHEERLARMFREFGPLVTVGRPEEKLPHGLGAWRTYIPRYGWKPIVEELIDNARVIVLGAGPGLGTVWEYIEVIRRRTPSRLVVVVTHPDGYQRFRSSTIAEAEGVLMELKARYGASWEAPLLPDLPAPKNPKVLVAYVFRAMVYFGPGWEPSLAFFDRSESRAKRQASRYYKRRLAPVLDHLRRGDRESAA